MTNSEGQSRMRIVQVKATRVFTQKEYHELVDDVLANGGTQQTLRDAGWDTYEGWVSSVTGGRKMWNVGVVDMDELNQTLADLNGYHNKESA